MSNTTFVNQSTVIVADWLNDVNDTVYEVLGNGTTVPATKAALRTSIDVPTTAGVGATGTWPINISGSAGSFSGVVAVANGGTGAATAAAAFAALKQAATDTSTGVVELATSAEAVTGTDTTRAITPATLFGGLNATGTAPIYACRAWVNFNGIGVIAIRGSGNVSSITDVGVGDYTINFTTAMPDINYSLVYTSDAVASNDAFNRQTGVGLVGSVKVTHYEIAAVTDTSINCVAIFR